MATINCQPMDITIENTHISPSTKLTKRTGPFSVQDLSELLKTSILLRTQIFPSSTSLPSAANDNDDDDDEFTIKPISSGYVNHAFIIHINEKFRNKRSPHEFFIKINRNSHAKQMFDAEVYGLKQLQEIYKDLIRIPQPYATGYLSDTHPDQGGWFLAEYIPMRNTATKRSDRQQCQFAELLAKMHQISAEIHLQSLHHNQYGFDIHNYYIHSQQNNTWQKDWSTFFIEQRLQPYIQRMQTDFHVEKNMELILLCQRLILYIPSFFKSNGAHLRPCLLHGDLSNQNWSVDKKDRIVFFDPSPFYGPYEIDMYTMSDVFVEAYFKAIGGPIEGYEIRFELYNVLRLVRSIIDSQLDIWRPLAFQTIKKLLIHCGAWQSSLNHFPCGIKTPIDKIQPPSLTKKNVILIYGGSFCPIHFGHLEVMNIVAEKLEQSPYNYEILAGYFCPSSQNWIKQKLPENYLPSPYRESLLILATEGTQWMIERSYGSSNTISKNILKAFREIYPENDDITLIHICGIDAIHANDRRVSIEHPVVVVDRLNYNGQLLWNEYIQKINDENRQRLIWVSPWNGKARSSTIIRQILTKLTDENSREIRENLQDFLPSSCIDYIFEYNLKNWFK